MKKMLRNLRLWGVLVTVKLVEIEVKCKCLKMEVKVEREEKLMKNIILKMGLKLKTKGKFHKQSK